MPELPEVESLVRALRPRLRGKRVLRLESTWPRALESGSLAGANRLLRGRRVVGLGRRGKYFQVCLEGGVFLVGHLRMSGNLLWSRRDQPRPPFLRHRVRFQSGHELRFVDARKFGRLWVSRCPDEAWGGLGPEPLAPAWTARRLARDLAGRRRMLKPLLLDQGFVAGLGNIYVDEALHRACLHPERTSDSLRREEAVALHRAIRKVLRAAIAGGGTSFDSVLRTAEGRPQGGYQARLRVYGRAGQPCPRCRGLLARTVVAQRGTWLCPTCQPRPRGRRRQV